MAHKYRVKVFYCTFLFNFAFFLTEIDLGGQMLANIPFVYD